MVRSLHIFVLIAMVIALVAGVAPASPAATSCQPINGAGLRAYLDSHPDVKGIVFFAAWCRDCKGKLESAGKEEVLVAVFESQKRADQIWNDVNKRRNPCFIDINDSVAESFGVKSLPFYLKR